jgi:Winged helix-turn helix
VGPGRYFCLSIRDETRGESGLRFPCLSLRFECHENCIEIGEYVENKRVEISHLRAARHQDPRALGYRATAWTTPLLTTHLNRECGCPVSERTLRRRLQEGGWRWKRPRYVFSERDIAIGQKKGAFAAD